jgi:hypothetical protein
MTYEQEQILKRFKSFGWRLGAFLAVAGLNFLAENVADLGMSPFVTTVVALMAGEVTKYLNR